MPDEKWTDIFPELIIPGALGVGAAFSPYIARGVSAGVGAMNSIGNLQDQLYRHRLQAEAAREMQGAFDPEISRLQSQQEQFRAEQKKYLDEQAIWQELERASRAVPDTGQFAHGGATLATSPPDMAGNQPRPPDVTDIWDTGEGVLSGESIPANLGTPGGDAALEKLGAPSAYEIWAEGTTPYDRELANLKIQRAASLVDPGTAAYSAGQFGMLQQGSMNERDRMAWQNYFNSQSAERQAAILKIQQQAEIGSKQAQLQLEDLHRQAQQQFVQGSGFAGTWSQKEGYKPIKEWDTNAPRPTDPASLASGLVDRMNEAMRMYFYAKETQDPAVLDIAMKNISVIRQLMQQYGISDQGGAPGAAGPQPNDPNAEASGFLQWLQGRQ